MPTISNWGTSIETAYRPMVGSERPLQKTFRANTLLSALQAHTRETRKDWAKGLDNKSRVVLLKAKSKGKQANLDLEQPIIVSYGYSTLNDAFSKSGQTTSINSILTEFTVKTLSLRLFPWVIKMAFA